MSDILSSCEPATTVKICVAIHTTCTHACVFYSIRVVTVFAQVDCYSCLLLDSEVAQMQIRKLCNYETDDMNVFPLTALAHTLHGTLFNNGCMCIFISILLNFLGYFIRQREREKVERVRLGFSKKTLG